MENKKEDTENDEEKRKYEEVPPQKQQNEKKSKEGKWRQMYYDECYIARYGHVRNGHRILVTYIHKEHRNLEIRKHETASLFRYETFLLLLS